MVSRAILVGPRIWEDLDSYDKNLKSKFVRAFRFLILDIHLCKLSMSKWGKTSFSAEELTRSTGFISNDTKRFM